MLTIIEPVQKGSFDLVQSHRLGRLNRLVNQKPITFVLAPVELSFYSFRVA